MRREELPSEEENKKIKLCEIEGNISGILSSLAYHLHGSSQTLLMEFWKRNVILEIFDINRQV